MEYHLWTGGLYVYVTSPSFDPLFDNRSALRSRLDELSRNLPDHINVYGPQRSQHSHLDAYRDQHFHVLWSISYILFSFGFSDFCCMLSTITYGYGIGKRACNLLGSFCHRQLTFPLSDSKAHLSRKVQAIAQIQELAEKVFETTGR